MVDILPGEHLYRDVYKLMTASIVPRPIAWVSTVNTEGQPNLAPFSFFNAVCSNPPTLLFCCSVRGVDGRQKDTYYNIEATGEFVVNFVTESLAEAMNITATEVPSDVNEFARAGLTAAPGQTVSVPHVAETPIYFECKLREIITINDEPGGASIILGTILLIHCDESVYREGYYIDLEAYQAVGRTTGPGYVRTRDRFDMLRPPSEITP